MSLNKEIKPNQPKPNQIKLIEPTEGSNQQQASEIC